MEFIFLPLGYTKDSKLKSSAAAVFTDYVEDQLCYAHCKSLYG